MHLQRRLRTDATSDRPEPVMIMRFLTRHAAVGLLVMVGFASGCDGFLDTAPQGALDELTLANEEGVEATLIGAYRMLGGNPDGFSSAPSNWSFGSITSDDAHKGSEPTDQGDANSLEYYDWSAAGAHNYLDGKWSATYEGISRANSTLRLLDNVLASDPGAIAEETANGIRGEALFLRAHYHFEAWRLWGNIPYYTEEDEDFRKPNTGADPVPQILQDLDAAIALLSDEPRNGQTGRASAWTARAYKGRVQVYNADWAGGAATLREVVADGPYALEQNYHRVWTALGEFANGPETILAFQASVNDGEPNGQNANSADRLNFPHAGSPFGCCGFHQPTQNLVNFFKVDANGLPLAISQGDLTPLGATGAWNSDNSNFVGGSMHPVDPRLDWTVGRDGVPYKDWGLHTSTWVRDPTFGGMYNGKKHAHEEAANASSGVGWNPAHLNSVNMHMYRFADLLLLLAEAEVELGNLEAARQIVNQIRERAGRAAQGPGTSVADIAVPIDDPRITWADYRIGLYPSFPNPDYARTAVRYERRLELAMEGQRMYDLRRWGVFGPVLNDYIQVERTRRQHLSAALEVTARHRWFPIPNRQIELSEMGGESRLVQNDGW